MLDVKTKVGLLESTVTKVDLKRVQSILWKSLARSNDTKMRHGVNPGISALAA